MLAKIIPEFIFTQMCKKHDLSYFIGGSEKIRKYADEIFYDEMKKAIDDVVYWSRWFYYSMAWLYYKAVRKKGKSSWSLRERPLTLQELKLEVATNYIERIAKT